MGNAVKKNCLTRINFRWLAGLSLMAIANVCHAADADLVDLMKLLAAAPATEVAFTEKKFSSLLAEPVISSGKLVYRRPDIVEKNIEVPRKENYRFAGDTLLLVRNGTEKKIALSSQPLLSAFAASLRGVLGGDLMLLRNYYQLSLQGALTSWRLDLTPIDEDTSRFVQRITVSGQAGRISQIVVNETSGDRSVLQVR